MSHPIHVLASKIIAAVDDEVVEIVLAAMALDVAAVNQANGWYTSERNFAQDVALLHSEVSEALEAYRRWGLDDQTGEECATDVEGVHVHGDQPCKPEGVGSELADVLIRLLDTAHRYDVDLAAEYRRKLDHNRVRGHRHGGKRL